MIQSGRYTIVYSDGQYRTLKVQVKTTGRFANQPILSFKQGTEYITFGTLSPNQKVNFWSKWYVKGEPVTVEKSPARKERIQRAVDRMLLDPAAAGLAFALNENCCYRCGRTLTVPASIHKGMGPECAKKNVKREDNKKVYDEHIQMKNQFAEHERRQEELGFASDPDFQDFKKGA